MVCFYVMIDAHLHLQDDRLLELASIDGLIAQCREVGIGMQFVNGTCPDDWSRVAKLAETYPGYIRPNYGLHPWFVQDVAMGWENELMAFLDHEGTVGVGEIGLDKWIRDYDLGKQKEAFRLQLDFACQRDLPATIHCLKAWGHLLETLRGTATPRQGFLLHSYSGPEEMVSDFVGLGAYFSLSGYFFQERKRARLETLLGRVPRERLLLETDAPDMALPEARRHFTESAANHPGNLIAVYEGVAEWLGEPVSSLVEQVRANGERLFGIPLGTPADGKGSAGTG